MRYLVHTVFDDFIPADADIAFTSSELNTRMGHHNQIGVQVVLNNLTVGKNGGTFDLFIEHCCDGRNWQQRNWLNQESSKPTKGDIHISALESGHIFSQNFSDACQGVSSAPGKSASGPLLPFVRFRMVFGSGTSGHVKVHAVHRDN